MGCRFQGESPARPPLPGRLSVGPLVALAERTLERVVASRVRESQRFQRSQLRATVLKRRATGPALRGHRKRLAQRLKEEKGMTMAEILRKPLP
mmetsp:Transcript_66187/g.153709  ORF Transcript_66187/g.153709 Transcript_66187/m.153709 type:complete len:94 (-) Transcript_66187:84-365(-)